jgi:hypothetical protein
MDNQMTTIDASQAMMETLLNPGVFDQMQRAATLFSKSGLVPAQFKDNMPACFVGLQLAAQLGVNPFMLFQKIYTVGGKIGIEAQVAIAVANQRKVFAGPISYEFSGEGKTRRCIARAVMAANKAPVEMSLSWSEVAAEGWDKKGGSKWNTMPDQMFRYRTALWLIRTFAPEVLMGLSSVDELEDSRVIDITPAKPKVTLEEQLKSKQADKPADAEIVDGDPAEGLTREEYIASLGVSAKMLPAYLRGAGLDPTMEVGALDDGEWPILLGHIQKIKGAK